METVRRFLLSALLLMAYTLAAAQTLEVSGTVTDANGEAIIGATVQEKATTNGTITDFDGNFQLNATKGATLVISYVDM